jgi:hypothetical protein
VTARDRLAGELKTQGRSDEAAEVKKLRRPSLVAWAINAAARERPGEVAGLLDAGADLRRAQRKTLSGGGAKEMRQATAARRAMIRTLVDAAVDAIGARGTAHRDAISATLDAASVDDELRERLRGGILERESRPAAGFGAVEGFEVLVGGGGATEEDAGHPEDREADARERTREARAAGQRAAAAERAAEKAARRAGELRTKAEAAVSAARDADAEAKRLAEEAKTERKRADRASKTADAAR